MGVRTRRLRLRLLQPRPWLLMLPGLQALCWMRPEPALALVLALARVVGRLLQLRCRGTPPIRNLMCECPAASFAASCARAFQIDRKVQEYLAYHAKHGEAPEIEKPLKSSRME